MKIGIEIEFNRPQNLSHRELAQALTRDTSVPVHAEGYNHQTRSHWKIVTDASLGHLGLELVSPPLEWNETSRDQVRELMAKMNEYGCTVNRQCGLHVHHDATNMPMAQMANIVRNYALAETVMDSIMPRSRRGNCRWANSLGSANPSANYDSIRRSLGHTRYRKVNVESYTQHRTVEFRQHSGTINASKIIHWVNLTGYIVAYSANGTFTTPTDIDDLFAKIKATTASSGRVRRGSGYAIRQILRGIAAGTHSPVSDYRIAEDIRAQFGGRTSERDVRWNRSQMRAGKFDDEVSQTGPALDVDTETEAFYSERAQDLA